MLNKNIANQTSEVTELDKELESYSLRDIGHVYVIEDKEKMIVKIGRSANPTERIGGLKRISCIEGREYVSHPILGVSSIENAAHKTLVKYRVSGEWFKISFKKAVEVVNSLLPAEVTSEQIEVLEKKEKKHLKLVSEYAKSMFYPNGMSLEERDAWITLR